MKIVNIKKDLKHIFIKGINKYGSGGMHTKIEAGKICQLAGTSMVIANGLYSNPISKIIEKNNCTWFSPCLLYTSPSPRDMRRSRMPSSA